MVKNNLKTALFCGVIGFSSIAVAQKSNEVNAAMEFQSFKKELMRKDYDDAKYAILEAKKYIDEAAVNPETKNSPKTLFYKGKIYLMIPALSVLTPEDQELKAMVTEEMAQKGVASLKKAYDLDEKEDFRDQIKMFALMGRSQAVNGGVEKFNSGALDSAQMMFETAIAMYDIIGNTDSLAYYNAGLAADRQGNKEEALKYYSKCAEIGYNSPNSDVLTSTLLRELGRSEEALKVVTRGRKKFPKDKGLLLEMVNVNLSMGDNAAAEKSLADAIAADPMNKQLYFAIGTIYDKANKPDKAVQAYEKALKIDSLYEDAAYSLGAHYVNLGAKIKKTADTLPFGDPNYDKILKKADGVYKQAIPYLEQAARINPKNPEVVRALFQLHRRLGNTDRAMEYKAKYDAIKK